MNLIALFSLGLFCGSFANVIIDRLAKKKGGIFFGRSVCPHCQHTLNPLDLIPLLSFIFLKGKCRYCQKKISLQYPIVELLMGIIFLLPVLLPTTYQPTTYLLLFALTTISIYDILYLEIPDQISLPTIGLILLASVLQLPLAPTITDALIGAAIPLAFFSLQILISRGRWIGGGDLRLGAIMGLALGWEKTLVALLVAYVSGAIFGLTGLLLKKLSRQSAVPFGPFLAWGTVVALFYGENIIQWYLARIGF
jgi:prepilin signal peptidase PulO-like enzyme (type II secretory pathway)